MWKFDNEKLIFTLSVTDSNEAWRRMKDISSWLGLLLGPFGKVEVLRKIAEDIGNGTVFGYTRYETAVTAEGVPVTHGEMKEFELRDIDNVNRSFTLESEAKTIPLLQSCYEQDAVAFKLHVQVFTSRVEITRDPWSSSHFLGWPEHPAYMNFCYAWFCILPPAHSCIFVPFSLVMLCCLEDEDSQANKELGKQIQKLQRYVMEVESTNFYEDALPIAEVLEEKYVV